MKKYLATIQIYATDDLLPDFFGEQREIVFEAEDMPHARGEVKRQLDALELSFGRLKSLEEIA